MKRSGLQASGQNSSHSPARHPGKEFTAGGRSAGSVSFVAFPLHRCSKLTGFSVRGQRSGRRMLPYGMTASKSARMWTGKNVQGTVMVLTILLFAERRRHVFPSPSSAVHRVQCEKDAGINWMPACVSESVAAADWSSLSNPPNRYPGSSGCCRASSATCYCTAPQAVAASTWW